MQRVGRDCRPSWQRAPDRRGDRARSAGLVQRGAPAPPPAGPASACTSTPSGRPSSACCAAAEAGGSSTATWRNAAPSSGRRASVSWSTSASHAPSAARARRASSAASAQRRLNSSAPCEPEARRVQRVARRGRGGGRRRRPPRARPRRWPRCARAPPARPAATGGWRRAPPGPGARRHAARRRAPTAGRARAQRRVARRRAQARRRARRGRRRGTAPRLTSCTDDVPFQSLRSTRATTSKRPPPSVSASRPPPHCTTRQVPAEERTTKRRCLLSAPIGRTSPTSTAGSSTDTPGLPRPNGSRRPSSSATSSDTSASDATASMRSTGDRSSSASAASAWAAKARANVLQPVGAHRHAGRDAVAAVRLAGAPRSPPGRRAGRRPAASGPTRGPPRPPRATSTTGRRRRSTSREATMPTTPACHSSDHSTRPRASRRSGSSSSCRRSASRRMRSSTACRSRLRSSSRSASARARRASSVSSSSSASAGWPSRPQALMRGATRKAISPAPARARSTWATASSASSPGAAAAAQPPQPGAHQPAVLVDQRHDVRDGRHGHEVEHPLQHRRIGSEAGHQRLAELERHAGPAQLGERVVAAAARHHEGRVGQLGGRAVVVGDHEVEAQRARPRRGLDRRDAAVDRQQEAAPGLVQALDRLRGEPVPLVEAAGQEGLDVRAARRQHLAGQGRRAHAVGVVVAVDDDAPPVGDGGRDRGRRPPSCRRAPRGSCCEPSISRKRRAASGSAEPAPDERRGRHPREAERLAQPLHRVQGCGRDGDAGQHGPDRLGSGSDGARLAPGAGAC